MLTTSTENPSVCFYGKEKAKSSFTHLHLISLFSIHNLVDDWHDLYLSTLCIRPVLLHAFSPNAWKPCSKVTVINTLSVLKCRLIFFWRKNVDCFSFVLYQTWPIPNLKRNMLILTSKLLNSWSIRKPIFMAGLTKLISYCRHWYIFL